MIRCTAQDIRYGTDESKMSALTFIYSQWFIDLCEVFGAVDLKHVRFMILYKQVAWRGAYE